MKFYRSYDFRVWDDIREELIISVGSGIIGLLALAWAVQRLLVDPFSFGLVMLLIAVLLILLCFISFPYGKGEIRIDNISLSILPHRGLLDFILPIPSSFSLQKELVIEVSVDWGRIHLKQEGIHKMGIIRGMSRNSLRKFTDILKIIATKHEKIKLEISQEIWTDKRLWFDQDETAHYHFQFENGDIIELRTPEGTDKHFDLKLVRKGKTAAAQYIVPAERCKTEYWGTPLVRWKIGASGPHMIVVRNRSVKKKNRARLDLTRYHRINHPVATADAPASPPAPS
jgi:hypothetical protein